MRLLHCISAVMALAVCGNASAQRMERIPFGVFESWTIREIKESAILGGETKTIYALAPNDTIRKNEVFSNDNTIWSSSNAYAVVMGTAALHIDRTSDGWVKNLRIPLINGDARKDASFEDYMDLRDIYYARNSAGSII